MSSMGAFFHRLKCLQCGDLFLRTAECDWHTTNDPICFDCFVSSVTGGMPARVFTHGLSTVRFTQDGKKKQERASWAAKVDQGEIAWMIGLQDGSVLMTTPGLQKEFEFR